MVFNYDDYVFYTREEAESVLENMNEILDDAGMVTVEDFVTLAGELYDFDDENYIYGWIDLIEAYITPVKDVGFIIVLPEPQFIG